jgi:uncharacterized membrane protein (DUF4010 family)
LNAGLAWSLLPFAAPAFLAGLAASLVTLRRGAATGTDVEIRGNPLQLRTALQMAVVFQIVIFVVRIFQAQLGDAGLLLSGAAAGLTDVDAATIAMARAVGDGVLPSVAGRAVAAGMLANTLLKLGLAITVGSGAFRLAAGAGLAAISIALALALFLL